MLYFTSVTLCSPFWVKKKKKDAVITTSHYVGKASGTKTYPMKEITLLWPCSITKIKSLKRWPCSPTDKKLVVTGQWLAKSPTIWAPSEMELDPSFLMLLCPKVSGSWQNSIRPEVKNSTVISIGSAWFAKIQTLQALHLASTPDHCSHSLQPTHHSL